jgi:hypothetical protein
VKGLDDIDRWTSARVLSSSDPIVPLPSFRTQHLRGLALLFRAWPAAELWGRPQEAELAARQVETAYVRIMELEGSNKELLAALLGLLPKNICVGNGNIRDDTLLPMDVTMGEIRAAAKAIANARASQDSKSGGES